MSDFELLIEDSLYALRQGRAIACRTKSWAGCVLSADSDAVWEADLEKLAVTAQTRCVLLVADERMLLKTIVSYDLNLTEQMESGELLLFEGIVGVKEIVLGDRESCYVQLVTNRLLVHLIKRMRTPLVVLIPQALPQDLLEIDAYD